MKKILYFEGAGCAPRGEVENCRIRTAFHLNDGRAVYLELIGVETTKHSAPRVKQYAVAGFVDFCFYVTGCSDDCNESQIPKYQHKTFEYTKKNILKLVNSLGCSFDEIVVLPDLAGYHVHGKGRAVNYGDKFLYDKSLTHRREEIRRHYYDHEKSEGKQYPNLSVWVDAENPAALHLLRHFSGFNKHWTIDPTAECWQDTVQETLLYSPGVHGVTSMECGK